MQFSIKLSLDFIKFYAHYVIPQPMRYARTEWMDGLRMNEYEN